MATNSDPPATDEPLWWSTDPLDPPAVLHLGRAQDWWWVGEDAACHDGARLWVRRGHRMAMVPLDGPVRGYAIPPSGFLAHGADATVAVHGDGIGVFRDPRERIGLDARAVRVRKQGWQAAALDLPVGGRRARDLQPFPAGLGAVWTDAGYLYRALPNRRPQPVGTAAPFELGPHSALVMGGPPWLRGCAPDGQPIELPEPLRESPLRWRPDGAVVIGLDDNGDTIWIDLRTAHVIDRQAGALPVGHHRWLDPATGAIRGPSQRYAWGVVEASWALGPSWLGGPGGVAWALDTLRPAFREPALELGATVALDDRFVTVHWDTGCGRIVDARTGAVSHPFEIPLELDDVVVRGVRSGSAAHFETALGRWYAVDSGTVTTIDEPGHPTPAPCPLVEPNGVRSAGRLWPVPAEHAVPWNGHVLAWNTDGLLVVLP